MPQVHRSHSRMLALVLGYDISSGQVCAYDHCTDLGNHSLCLLMLTRSIRVSSARGGSIR